MSALIKKIASYLMKHWNSLSKPVKWAIEQVASSALVTAVEHGVSYVVNELEKYSSTTIHKIAKILNIN
jgi:hypothetical protein